jgi:quinol monooxygenase YgiN
MIVVWGIIPLKPERRDEALREMVEFARLSRAEAGCHAHYFTMDLEDPNKIHLFEHWENRESMAVQDKSQYKKRFMEKYYDMRTEAAHLVVFEPQTSKWIS